VVVVGGRVVETGAQVQELHPIEFVVLISLYPVPQKQSVIGQLVVVVVVGAETNDVSRGCRLARPRAWTMWQLESV